MAYTKQNWQTGDKITAAKLNHIEDGIEGEYDIVFTITEDGITADGASFEELISGGYKKALWLNDFNELEEPFMESTRFYKKQDSINIVGFEFYYIDNGGALSTKILMSSDGQFSFDGGEGTYTYSNGHYTFTPDESGT